MDWAAAGGIWLLARLTAAPQTHHWLMTAARRQRARKLNAGVKALHSSERRQGLRGIRQNPFRKLQTPRWDLNSDLFLF